MTERGEGDDGPIRGEPPAPPKPFDPSTGEFPEVELEEEGGRAREAERIEQRHEAVSMDTSTFMAIPAPTPTTPFIPPDFDERQGRLGHGREPFEQRGEPVEARRARLLERVAELGQGGERRLVLHPRCGTSWLFVAVLASFFAMLSGIAGLASR